jgi:hypothetical protein
LTSLDIGYHSASLRAPVRDKLSDVVLNIPQGGLNLVIRSSTFAGLVADPLVLSTRFEQFLFPFSHPLVSVFLAFLPFLQAFAPGYLVGKPLEILQNGPRGIDGGRDPRVVWRKLLELALDHLVLDPLIAPIHDQQ